MRKHRIVAAALSATSIGALILACSGGPGDVSSGGINEPIGSSGGGNQKSSPTPTQPGSSGSGSGSGSSTSSGSSSGSSSGTVPIDSGPADTSTGTSIVCGTTVCTGSQDCVVPCCGGVDTGVPCTPPPRYCVTKGQTVTGCTKPTGSGRFYTCVCA